MTTYKAYFKHFKARCFCGIFAAVDDSRVLFCYLNDLSVITNVAPEISKRNFVNTVHFIFSINTCMCAMNEYTYHVRILSFLCEENCFHCFERV